MGLQNGGKVDSVRDCVIHCKFVQVAVFSYTKNGKLIGLQWQA